jgi:RimJ/RimL family protein N-acetyltransferase
VEDDPRRPVANGVRLRAARDGHAAELVAAGTDPGIAASLDGLPRSHDEARRWIDRADSLFMIEDGEKVVGGVELRAVRRGTGELAFWVRPEARCQGVATAAVRAMTGWALPARVNRLELVTDVTNIGAQRIALTAGFTREGVRRSGRIRPDGSRSDEVVWGRVAGDPPGPRPRPLPDLPGCEPPGNEPPGNEPPDGEPRGRHEPHGQHDAHRQHEAHGQHGLGGRLAVGDRHEPPDGGARTAGRLGGELSDGVVLLRPLGPADVDNLYALMSLPDVAERQVPPGRFSRQQCARRCAHTAADWLAGNRAGLAIADAATGAFAGEISLSPDGLTGEGWIGYSLLPAWRGRGLTTRAVRLLVGWALEVGFPRLCAGTMPDNVASQRVLEAAGFTLEGIRRAELPGHHGTRNDDHVYVLLAADAHHVP